MSQIMAGVSGITSDAQALVAILITLAIILCGIAFLLDAFNRVSGVQRHSEGEGDDD